MLYRIWTELSRDIAVNARTLMLAEELCSLSFMTPRRWPHLSRVASLSLRKHAEPEDFVLVA